MRNGYKLNSEEMNQKRALEILYKEFYDETIEYNTKLKIVDKINFGDGVSRYDLRQEGAKHFHHHLVCIECGAVDEIQEDLLEDVEAIVEKRWNFMIKDHRLTFHGICWRCHDGLDKDNSGDSEAQPKKT